MIYKKIIFCLILFFLIFVSVTPIFALEAKYPYVPGAPFIHANSTLPELIQYFFAVGIYFSGAIALISLAIAGIQLIMSQANPEGMSSAKDRIKGSLLGLGLLMISFLIIKSINPVLLEPKITELTSGPGVYLVSDNKETTCPSSSDVSALPPPFQNGKIAYRCATPNDPILLVWTYDKPGLDSSGSPNTVEVPCGSSPISIGGNIKSFKIAFKTPGIYFYKNRECTGYRSSVILTSGELPEEFKRREVPNNNRCIELINSPANKTYFGAVLHAGIYENGGSDCQFPVLSFPLTGNLEENVPIDVNTSSVSVFMINDDFKTSGDGVDFYSGPFGWNTKDYDGGIFKIQNTCDAYDANPNPSPYIGCIRSSSMWFKPAFMKYDYTGSDAKTDIKDKEPSFQKQQGSMKIKGNYLVALYSGPNNTNGYCQIFRQDVTDFKGTEFLGKNKEPGIVYVIPTK